VSGVPPRKKRPHDEPVTLTDPAAIKGLAHPARLAVLDELRQGSALTATECAAIAGLSASAMSYHLRALERWGFVERAEDTGDGRERPWRATSSRGWRIQAPGPAGLAAASALLSAIFDRLRNDMFAWTEVEHDQPKIWQEVASVGNSSVWLTPAEARELVGQYEKVNTLARGRTAADHPQGARRVRLGVVIAPSVRD
jgi:DNA-binding transcriptional ArsR family regulator